MCLHKFHSSFLLFPFSFLFATSPNQQLRGELLLLLLLPLLLSSRRCRLQSSRGTNTRGGNVRRRGLIFSGKPNAREREKDGGNSPRRHGHQMGKQTLPMSQWRPVPIRCPQRWKTRKRGREKRKKQRKSMSAKRSTVMHKQKRSREEQSKW